MVFPLKEGITISNAFRKKIESNRKPIKILKDKRSSFCNRSVNSSLQDNDIKIYATHNEGKIIDAERFIRTLQNKVYKFINSILKKNLY